MVSASIDFGTTNSVAMLNVDGKTFPVKLGKSELYTPTALFFSFDEHKFYVGDEAIEKLEDGEFGRYFVSLKTFLGSKESIETTLGQDIYSIEDLIAIILKRFKDRIDERAGCSVTKLTLGRPVKFNDSDKDLDLHAQNSLKRAALKAGFRDIRFCFEPVAAAMSYKKRSDSKELIMVADIGGGTTDYTIIELKNNKIISTNGVYIGGNSFDSKIIREFVSKHLGEGLKYKNMGKEMVVSHSLYVNLYDYYKFIKMYNRQIIDSIKKYIQMANDKEPISRLLELIEDGLYFDFIKSVTSSKIELSSCNRTKIDMSFFIDPFSVDITEEKFNKVTKNELKKIEETMEETLKIANLKKESIDRVFLTGGTTLIPSVKNIFKNSFGEEKLMQTDVFSSVGYGLSLYEES